MTKTVTSSPDSTTSTAPSQTLLEACLTGCSQSLESAEMICQRNHKHEIEADRHGCTLERTVVGVICQQKCVTEYGSTKPTKPTEPTEPSEPSEPTEPTKPVGPTDPTIPPTSTTHL